MDDLTLIAHVVGKTCANMDNDEQRGVILEVLYTGKPIAEIVPEYEKRVDTLAGFFSAFLRVLYLYVEDNI